MGLFETWGQSSSMKRAALGVRILPTSHLPYQPHAHTTMNINRATPTNEAISVAKTQATFTHLHVHLRDLGLE